MTKCQLLGSVRDQRKWYVCVPVYVCVCVCVCVCFRFKFILSNLFSFLIGNWESGSNCENMGLEERTL